MNCLDVDGLEICFNHKILILIFFPQLQHYLQEISFSISGEEVNFDIKGDAIPSYDLINWQRSTSGDMQFVKVGLYDGAQHSGKELVIEEQAITWSNQQTKARC